MPSSTVIPPLMAITPPSVIPPVPVFDIARTPSPSRKTLRDVPVALPSPMVSVALPAEFVTVPEPVGTLIVSLNPFRSNRQVPAVVITRLLFPAPLGITSAAPSFSVPWLTVVRPP